MNIPSLEKKLEVETGSSWTIGVSTLLSPYDPAKGVTELLESNLDLRRIEIALADQLENEERTGKRLAELGGKYDLQYSVHAPFLYDDLAHPKDTIREINVDEGVKTLDLAASIEARHVVFHPGEFFFRQNLPPLDVFEPFRKSREDYLRNSLQSLTTLSEYGTSRGVDLLIENLPHGLCEGPEEMKYLLSRIQNSSFIMDIGHANISGSLEELLDLKPQYFHFNDNDGEEDDHRPLGKGAIDLNRLITRMTEYEGDKTIIFELYSLEDVQASLEVFRECLEY